MLPIPWDAGFSTNIFVDSNTVRNTTTTDAAMIIGWDPLNQRVPLEVPPAAPRLNWRNGAEPDSIRGKSIFSKKKS